MCQISYFRRFWAFEDDEKKQFIEYYFFLNLRFLLKIRKNFYINKLFSKVFFNTLVIDFKKNEQSLPVINKFSQYKNNHTKSKGRTVK